MTGTATHIPTVTTVYTLTASGKNAEEVTRRTRRVTVAGEPNAPTALLSGPTNAVGEGDAFRIGWTTTNASSVTLTAIPGGTVLTQGQPVAAGMVELTAQRLGLTQYRLRAVGPTGLIADSALFDVNVNPADPAMASLTTETSTTVAYGEKVTLTWSVTNAASVTLTANPGGLVELPDSEPVMGASKGEVMVMPTISPTTYTLTAYPVGQDQSPGVDDVTFNVNPARPPMITVFEGVVVDGDAGDDIEAGLNDSVTLTGTVSNAASISLMANGTTIYEADVEVNSASVGVFGDEGYEVRPTVTTVYALTAIGERDTDSDSKTVTVTVTEMPGGSFIRTVQ